MPVRVGMTMAGIEATDRVADVRAGRDNGVFRANKTRIPAQKGRYSCFDIVVTQASQRRVTLGDFRPGDTFASRTDLAQSGMHRPRRAGIGGTIADGAESIVLSGFYEDDVDSGDTVSHAGHGGRDTKMGRQIAHQTLDRYNAALMRSYEMGKPIRLIRGRHYGTSSLPKQATDTKDCTGSSQ